MAENDGGVEVRRRPGGRSATVRTSVQRATLQLLEEVGFDGLEVPQVARRAGVHKATVYRRWPTKTALVADAVESLVSTEVPVPDTGNLRDDLVAYLTDIGAVLRTRAARALLAALVDGYADPALAAARDRFWAGRFHGSSVMVERAIDRGELRADTDPHLLLEEAAAPIYFRLLVSGERVDDEDVLRLARRACDQR